MKSLWLLGEASVKQVREEMLFRKQLAYTTVMTLLERLVKRGRAQRRKQGRAFLYSPLATQAELRRLAVEELLLLHFDGSREELQVYLNGARPHAEELPEADETRLDTTLL
ncbi:MAG: BlaI/MecI/CopY family transcriptional regulator [Bryobacterales bacterium]|nr:BlaI/MecI/CopY family transcriptional regulator [Bryobacterales bacterium]